MTKLHSTPTPIHSPREWRGVVFSALPRLLPCSLAAVLGAGCSFGTSQQTAAPQKITVKSSPRLSPITNQTIQSWLQRAFAPRKAATQTSEAKKLIFVDAAALAKRHPAWLLADSLESRRVAVAAIKTDQGNPPQLPALPPVKGALPPPAGKLRRIGAETVRLNGESTDYRRQQYSATERFLTVAAERNDQLARDAERWARQFLEDEVEVARRKAITEIDPKQLSPEVQLQLENLTLELLPRIRRSSSEKAAALRQIQQIEQSWQKDLRQQERQQVAQVERALNEVPKEVRRQGEERIQRLLTRIRTERAGYREAVRSELDTLMDQDFAASNLDLEIKLPSASIEDAPSVRSSSIAAGKIKTLQPLPPSQGRRMSNQLTISSSSRTQLIKDLRAEALRESKGWAALAAMELGGELAQGPGVPNRTADAIRLVRAHNSAHVTSVP